MSYGISFVIVCSQIDIYIQIILLVLASCRKVFDKRQPRGSQGPPRGSPEAAKSLLETAKTSQEAARRQPKGAPAPAFEHLKRRIEKNSLKSPKMSRSVNIRAPILGFLVPTWGPKWSLSRPKIINKLMPKSIEKSMPQKINFFAILTDFWKKNGAKLVPNSSKKSMFISKH